MMLVFIAACAGALVPVVLGLILMRGWWEQDGKPMPFLTYIRPSKWNKS